MDKTKMKKIFPSYFKNIKLPSEAKEQKIVVYRACETGKIEKASFLNTYEYNGFKVNVGSLESDPQQYSLSTYFRPKDLKRFVTIDSKYDPPFLLAKGVTNPGCGICCKTNEWKKPIRRSQKRNSHVDYWLYKGAQPWEDFKETDYGTEIFEKK